MNKYSRFSKFIVIGVVNTIVDLSILNFILLIIPFKTAYIFFVARSFSFIVATLGSYLLNKHIVFSDRNREYNKKQFLSFVSLNSVSFIINIILSTYAFVLLAPLFITYPHLHSTVSSLFGPVIVSLLNYFLYHKVIFK